jgi:hypothetical protein
MKAKQLVLIIAACVILVLNSCAPAYVPNVINAPLLTNRGEVQAAINAGTSGVDPQFAYAISNHIGMMVNGSFENQTSDTTNNFHKHSLIEIGAGYYTYFGTRMKFETFGGMGFGKLQAEYDNNMWVSRSDVNCSRYFIQPTIGFTTKVFDAGISSRFVLVNLHQQSGKSNTGLFMEPAITAKLGYDHIKALMQLGVSMPLNSNKLEFSYQPFLFSIGLRADFGKVFK